MQYSMLKVDDQRALLERLASMPRFLTERFGGLSADAAQRPGPGESFSPVEHCWHLADLEVEGFGVRIRRLRNEIEPHLPDFDGGRVAAEREYRKQSLAAGIEAFGKAREATLRAIAEIAPSEWERSGIQEGVGRMMLCDLPHMIAEHDDAHRAEIETWVRAQV